MDRSVTKSDSTNLELLAKHIEEQDRISKVHSKALYDARVLVEKIVNLARFQDIGVQDIALRTGDSIESITALERWSGDPKLSTILRYADAAGLDVSVSIHLREKDQ